MSVFSLLFLIWQLFPEKNAAMLEARRSSAVNSYTSGHLLWRYPGIDDIECVSGFPDIDGDGAPDVLVESFDAGASGSAHFFCLSGRTGDTIWAVWPPGGVSNSGGWGDQCVSTISDLNGNGFCDALLGTAWGGRTVFALDGGDGSVIWSYDTYHDSIASGWVYCVAALPDVDGDSIPEVIAGTGTYCQTVFCFSGATGRILWRFYAQDAIGSVCAIRDVDGDGYADVIAGAWGNGRDRKVYCISGNSRGNQPRVIWSFDAQADVYCVRPIADVNGSGYDDVIASSWSNYVYCLEGSSGAVIWSSNIGNYGMRIEVLGDITGDSVPEVIVGSWNPAVILLDGRSGAPVWRTGVGDDVWTVYAVDDVNGDAKPDVVCGSGDGGIYCLSGADGAIIWSYPTGGWVNSVRSIGDVNGDALDDVVAGNQYSGSPGYVYCLEGDTAVTALAEPTPPRGSADGGAINGRFYDTSGRRVTDQKSGVYFVISRENGRLTRRKLLIRR